jgi:hypothetical protein
MVVQPGRADATTGPIDRRPRNLNPSVVVLHGHQFGMQCRQLGLVVLAAQPVRLRRRAFLMLFLDTSSTPGGSELACWCSSGVDGATGDE